MAVETKTPFLLLLLILSLFFFAFLSPCRGECKFTANECTKVQGMFVFGSSLVDNGNNNFLVNSLAKANYLPYGVDFPLLGPSGRFTNGKNVIDIIGEHLKLPVYIPNFNDPETKGSKIVNGVNFASGGSGILDNTGAVAGEVISLNKQIRNFENVTLAELEEQLGCKSNESLKDYLFVVGSGGNDYSLNYFLGLTNNNVSLQDFTANLTTTLSHQLKRLYNMGARKFVLMALYPNGCSPMARARNPMTTGCIESLNRAALLFNANLRSLVDSIRLQMPGSTLVFVNAYKVIMDILQNPTPKGFGDTKNPCCEVGGTGTLCKMGGNICSKRNAYVYFDGLHPTEAVNIVLANKAFASNLKAEVYPTNVKLLSQV
ncbi:GDSL esterase/lipase At1g29670-like [Nicotiana sylvestris]|uniref:GDSL esterase/lipase At1g29670-like n=2 Tax=Nicotiana TaxID=4085 RepID=A0A1S4DEM4_TOBAC|nr:PREDICTED: GDSL esterase/lipase At1g29670-like [Nicotiana sylvestris]XP_016511679.1 PREDICTED: GDSL esterase/lipase At1g29670-like [Nicotiana tabacum]